MTSSSFLRIAPARNVAAASRGKAHAAGDAAGDGAPAALDGYALVGRQQRAHRAADGPRRARHRDDVGEVVRADGLHDERIVSFHIFYFLFFSFLFFSFLLLLIIFEMNNLYNLF
jgi:hypothetical protein